MPALECSYLVTCVAPSAAGLQGVRERVRRGEGGERKQGGEKGVDGRGGEGRRGRESEKHLPGLSFIAIPLTRFSRFPPSLPPASILPSTPPLLKSASFIPLQCCTSIPGPHVRLHVRGRRIFPMGPQVKTGTHSVGQGTPSVPVAALAGGEPCHPSSVPLHPYIPPSTHVNKTGEVAQWATGMGTRGSPSEVLNALRLQTWAQLSVSVPVRLSPGSDCCDAQRSDGCERTFTWEPG
ncbi:unnamed protein product [Pleuronectes platessa]|uniref:Uncharacterized protein n=1 Tax=Pleuronectes platessa TaxID=8262 RepID=A0A9N7YKM2_PLEPL|nr:unnamed protein product [Pleuronectes platessa]